MKTGKIVQLSDHNVEGVRVPAASVAGAFDGPTLVARIARLERRQTDLALEMEEMRKLLRQTKGAR